MQKLLLIILFLCTSMAFAGPIAGRPNIVSLASDSTFIATNSYYSELGYGLNKFQIESKQFIKKSNPILLIVGINETGETWIEPLLHLISLNSRDIYLFKWNKHRSYKKISNDIAKSISFLQQEYSDFENISVLAHSAGGVLLLNSLSEGEESFSNRVIQKINFNTVASPLGGYHYNFSFMALPFIGSVASFVGSHVKYKNIDSKIWLRVFTTTFENDTTVSFNEEYDIRLPELTGDDKKIDYSTYELRESSHISAVFEALKVIIENE